MSSIAKSRVFYPNSNEVLKYLFCNNSDTEEALYADGEDIRLLESNIELFVLLMIQLNFCRASWYNHSAAKTTKVFQ